MPPDASLEYNPNILGFIADKGPIIISLEKARNIYGKLPSDYEFVPKKDGRQNKKGLNLDIGKLVTEKLGNQGTNLKETVFDFFGAWHRDYGDEFGIHIDPFLNLNHPDVLKGILKKNHAAFLEMCQFNLRTHLTQHGHIRKDILNSIPERDLSKTAEKILAKKMHHLGRGDKRSAIFDTLTQIRTNRVIQETGKETSFDFTHPTESILST